ncbi:MAG: hypothetical protein EBR82_85495, partial [Caulobacteraceae bacterium]|nr:hypothetical protein [Caulobacteraceae bacterium]
MFNLNDYETVEIRLDKWHDKFPDSRVETELIEASNTRFIVFAKLFKTEADAKPCATGLAFENITEKGVNSTSALENCETSAIGRALANAGFAAKGKRASREEMAKVNNAEPNTYENKLQERRYGSAGSRSAAVEDALRASFAVENKQDDPALWNVEQAVDAIGKTTPKEPPVCCNKGHTLKQGISKAGKPYYGYVCKDKNTG